MGGWVGGVDGKLGLPRQGKFGIAVGNMQQLVGSADATVIGQG